MEYKIGTRGSKLALVQAEYVCKKLQEAYPEDKFTLKVIQTTGDLVQDRPLDQLGDKGVFVREIEHEILSGEVQIGVHSMKDMPSDHPEGLCFTKSWKREDARDVLLLREKSSLTDLPEHAVIGTGSKRRAYQLHSLRPDLRIVPIRGNVDTRIRKMKEQKKAINEADCVIYDRLVSPELLKQTKTTCELIYVGKENHHHTMNQTAINQLLVDKAMQYDSVVRLKGGDSYVFGRGGEEGLYLGEKGVPFMVIPGITSAIAGLAAAGIPITHRGLSAGFHVVTAHNSKDELADIDFQGMAKGHDTCVFLMGLSNLEEIVTNLLKEGMSSEMEAAVISNATTPFQHVCAAPLNKIAEEVRKADLKSPAIIVIGHVVSLRKQLNFYEHQPLFGKKYLIPTIGKDKTLITTKLEQAGASVTELQVGEIEINVIDLIKEECSKVNWIIFTSKNGVKAFFQNCVEQKIDMRSFRNAKFAAISSGTEKCLQEHGIFADFIPVEYNSINLEQQLCKELKPSDSVWYFKAQETTSNLGKTLNTYCFLQEFICYQNREIEIQELSNEEILAYDGLIFTCGSSAQRILSHLSIQTLDTLNQKRNCYVIGPQTKEMLKKYRISQVNQADHATYDSLFQTIYQK